MWIKNDKKKKSKLTDPIEIGMTFKYIYIYYFILQIYTIIYNVYRIFGELLLFFLYTRSLSFNFDIVRKYSQRALKSGKLVCGRAITIDFISTVYWSSCGKDTYFIYFLSILSVYTYIHTEFIRTKWQKVSRFSSSKLIRS